MCSIRALWLVRSDGEVLFSRRYPTVENRVRLSSVLTSSTSQPYVPIPTDSEFAEAFIAEVLNSRDTASLYPVCALRNGEVWPVAIMKRGDLYLCAVPALDENLDRHADRETFLRLPSITAVYSLLGGLVDLVLPHAPKYLPADLADLESLLCNAMPFGTPIDTNAANVQNIHNFGFPTTLSEPLTSKRPAWKPYLFKGKQRFDILTREEIRATLYDSPMIPDVCDVTGAVACKTELEGMPDINIPLPETVVLRSVSVHHCVQTQDVLRTREIVFSPPFGTFTLCRYQAAHQIPLPIHGFFSLKELGPHEVKMIVQLKLNNEMSNKFEFCELHMPFYNRGPITHMEVSPTAGTVGYGQHRRSIVWNIGQKFPSRNLEVAMPGTIRFDPTPSTVSSDDPFLVGANCYVQVVFKLLRMTFSGFNIDPRAISIHPNSKVPVTVEREALSSEYIIWNSLGEARSVAHPPPVPAPLSSVE